MDLSEKDKFEREKRGEDQLKYQATNHSDQWQFGNPSSSTYQGNQMSDSPCPSASMVDSFSLSPSLWNHPTNVQTSVTGSISAPIGKPVVMLPRLDMGSEFLPAGPNVLPPSLSHFSVDSAFVERAARLSCFNGGSFSGMVSPFSKSESLSPYSNTSRGSPKNSSMPTPSVSNFECVLKDQRDKGSLCSKESVETDFSAIGPEGTPNLRTASGDSSSRNPGTKRRKRTCQEIELEPDDETPVSPTETAMENAGCKQKDERKNSTKATLKATGKQPKDTMEAPKQDYIHVRAPRGQATNSHSLAERVRREKISERMKYLQDLVPGCSKVTGKAVMLDEIINYVQSLQRQVEFLSMKLATVNPRLDYNIEGILSKDFLARDGSSSAMGFSNDMIHPPSHIAQLGLIPSGIAYPSDAMKRALSAQLTMMPNSWDDEIHNVFQMNFSTTNPPLNSHELSGIPRDGFPN